MNLNFNPETQSRSLLIHKLNTRNHFIRAACTHLAPTRRNITPVLADKATCDICKNYVQLSHSRLYYDPIHSHKQDKHERTCHTTLIHTTHHVRLYSSTIVYHHATYIHSIRRCNRLTSASQSTCTCNKPLHTT